MVKRIGSLIGLMMVFSQAFAQVDYIMSAHVYAQCGQVRVNVKNSGSTIYTTDFSNVTWNDPNVSGSNWRLVSLPADLTNITMTVSPIGDGACCDLYANGNGGTDPSCGQEVDLYGGGSCDGSGNGRSWSLVINSPEIAIGLYKKVQPTLSPTSNIGCSYITATIPGYCYLGQSPQPSWEIHRVRSGVNSGWQTYASNAGPSIDISPAQVAAVFGNWDTGDIFTVKAVDGSFALPVSQGFRLYGSPPTFTISPKNKICQTSGGINITVTNANAPNTVSHARVYIKRDGGAQIVDGSVAYPTNTLHNTFFPLDPGAYTIILENFISDDPDNACATTSGFTIGDDSYTLSLSAPPSPKRCATINDGSIDLTVNNGSPGYTYTWTKTSSAFSASTQDISGLSEGQYNVSVKDLHQCPGSTSATITTPSSLSGSAVAESVSCTSGQGPINDGKIIFTASGGSGSIEYSIDGGGSWQNGNQFTTQTAGLWNNLKIRDKLVPIMPACTLDIAGVTVGTPGSTITGGSFSVTQPCSGSTTGAISLSGASGGTGALTWSMGGPYQAVASNFTGISPGGPFPIIVRDANNCSVSLGSITIRQPVTGAANTTQQSCTTIVDGTISVSASGGTGAGYEYSLDGGGYQIPNSFTKAAGDYSITIKDGSGCTSATIPASVTMVTPVLSATVNQTAFIQCNGQSTAALQAIPSGGVGPTYSYTWRKGATTVSSTQTTTATLNAGDYDLTVTDTKGCTKVVPKTITQPTAITASAGSTANVTCNGLSNGSVTVNANGGTPVLSYSKDGSNFQAGNTLTGFSAGAYTVTVKDANSCTTSFGGTITQPPAITITSATPTAVTCNGGSNGSIAVVASPGTGTLTYSKDGATFLPGSTFNGLAATTYTITVMDQNSCTKATAVTVTEPSPISATVTQTATSCNGVSDGSLSVSASNGALPFSYSHGSGFQSSNVFTGLAATGYTITIRDANLCAVTRSATVTQPTAVNGTISVTTVISCPGGNNGALSVAPSGGTPSYTYAWQHGPATQAVTGLVANTYSVEITDSKGCTGTVNNVLSQPSPITITRVLSNYNGFNIRCHGESNGFADLTVTGGNVGGYTYLWGHGPITQDISSRPAGTYTVDVRDSKNCLATTSVILTEPDVLSSSVSTFQHVSCFGGTNGAFTLSSLGGAGSYNYSINGGSTWNAFPAFSGLPIGNYSIITRDVNTCASTIGHLITSPTALNVSLAAFEDTKCGESNGSATASGSGGAGGYSFTWYNSAPAVIGSASVINNLAAGAYEVRITDQNSCSTTLPVPISTSNGPTINLVSSTDNTCFENSAGQATIDVLNAAMPYTILWPNGQSGLSATNLPSGANTVQVTDNDGCTTFKGVVINSPAAITVQTVSEQKPSCFGRNDGSVLVTASGGNGTYSYLWNNGTSGTQITTVTAGSYTVNVLDQLGCAGTRQITLSDPEVLTVDIITKQDPLCHNFTDGIIEVAGKGGNGSYNYLWNTGSTAYYISGLSSQQYTLTTTDSKGCSDSRSITLVNPELVAIAIESTKNPTCFGKNDGVIEVTASGGNGQFTYLWSNSATTKKIENLLVGAYTVTATDKLGCTLQREVTLTQPALLEVDVISANDPSCAGIVDGTVKVLARGGTVPYQYSWSNGLTTEQITAQGGQYLVTVKDNANCQATKAITLTDPPAIFVNLVEAKNPTCFGSSDGSIQVEASGGKGQLSYAWNTSAITNIVNTLKSGLYKITVSDISGCAQSREFTLTDPEKLLIDLGPDKQFICPGSSLAVGKNIDNVSYAWTGPNGFSSNASSITTAIPGFYFIKITDGKGCEATDVFELSISNDLLKADFLMVSEVHAGDTVMMIDISWPLPENIQWQFPPNVTMVNSDGPFAEVVFNKPGDYGITLQADLGGCVDDFVKFIKVLEERINAGGRLTLETQFIRNVQMLPNPNYGVFAVTVELREEAEAYAVVVNADGSRIIYSERKEGSDDYTWGINLPGISSGVYYLIVKSQNNVEVLRFIKL